MSNLPLVPQISTADLNQIVKGRVVTVQDRLLQELLRGVIFMRYNYPDLADAPTAALRELQLKCEADMEKAEEEGVEFSEKVDELEKSLEEIRAVLCVEKPIDPSTEDLADIIASRLEQVDAKDTSGSVTTIAGPILARIAA